MTVPNLPSFDGAISISGPIDGATPYIGAIVGTLGEDQGPGSPRYSSPLAALPSI